MYQLNLTNAVVRINLPISSLLQYTYQRRCAHETASLLHVLACVF